VALSLSPGLSDYLKKVLTQLSGSSLPSVFSSSFFLSSSFVRVVVWLAKGQVKKLVLVVTGMEKNEVLERFVSFLLSRLFPTP
jgi:hypothetical protein